MIEPTETEAKETLDDFCEAMLDDREGGGGVASQLKSAPHSRPVSRPDEAGAAKRMTVRHHFGEAG